jgi:hypothetical protein
MRLVLQIPLIMFRRLLGPRNRILFSILILPAPVPTRSTFKIRIRLSKALVSTQSMSFWLHSSVTTSLMTTVSVLSLRQVSIILSGQVLLKPPRIWTLEESYILRTDFSEVTGGCTGNHSLTTCVTYTHHHLIPMPNTLSRLHSESQCSVQDSRPMRQPWSWLILAWITRQTVTPRLKILCAIQITSTPYKRYAFSATPLFISPSHKDGKYFYSPASGFTNPVIAKYISQTWFSRGKYSKIVSSRKKELFLSSIKEKPLEVEMTKAMVIMASCAVSIVLIYSLSEYVTYSLPDSCDTSGP